MTIERISFSEGFPLSKFGQADYMHDLEKAARFQIMRPGKHLVTVPAEKGVTWLKEVEVHPDRTATITTINTTRDQSGNATNEIMHLNKVGDDSWMLAIKDGQMYVYEAFKYKKDSRFWRLMYRLADNIHFHP